LYAPDHEALRGPWAEAFLTMGRQPTSYEPTRPPSPTISHILECSAATFDLLVYLIASHHGKVRVALHAAPRDQDYRARDQRGLPIRGVREGDRLPSVTLEPGGAPLPEISLTLDPAMMGLSPRTGASWRDRTNGVLERHGPAALAYMESILRAADVRASRLQTNDPALNPEAST
jgi:CRISPR-associated endonuclease/helicase Cas3